MKKKNKSSPKWKSLSRIILKGSNTKMKYKNLELYTEDSPSKKIMKGVVGVIAASALVGLSVYACFRVIDKRNDDIKKALNSYTKLENVIVRNNNDRYSNVADDYRKEINFDFGKNTEVSFQNVYEKVAEINHNKLLHKDEMVEIPIYPSKSKGKVSK